MNCGGPISDRFDNNYYYSCLGSDPYLIVIDPPMAEHDSTTNSLNDEAHPSNRDDGWLQLSIGSGGHGDHEEKYDQPELRVPERSSGLVELNLLPGGGDGGGAENIQRSYRWVSSSLDPETELTARTRMEMETRTEMGIGMPLFFGTSSSSNFVQQEINWAFRPAIGVGIGIGMAQVPPSSSPSTSAASSSSFLPFGGRRSSYFGRPFIQFQGAGVDAEAAGPSTDIRIINPPRRPHSGIWFTLKALENQ